MLPSSILSLTCKEFNRLSNENTLWRVWYFQRWSTFSKPLESVNWKYEFQARKDYWKEALPLFNSVNPKKGIEMLIQEGKVRSAEDIAQFLRFTNQLDKRKIGSFLGESESIESGILKAFLKTFDFQNMEIDNAFRNFLKSLALPPSTKKIQMLLSYFSDRYYDCNRDCPFKSSDSIYTIVYSLLMLNTDLHNRNVKKKLKPSYFVDSVLLMEENSDLSRIYLESLYHAIKQNPLIDYNVIVVKQEQSSFQKFKTKFHSMFQ